MQRLCGFLLNGCLAVMVLAGCQSQSAPSAPEAQSTPRDLPVVAEALALAEKGKMDAALELLNSAIEQHPQEGRLYGARATLHHRAGLNRQAFDDLNQAISAAPDDAQLLNNRGFVLLSLERYDEAIRDLELAMENNPRLASARNNRGLVSLAQGKHRDAIDWFGKALALEPKYVDALNNRGFAWMQFGRLENAFADLNEALRVSPKYVNALHNRGLLNARAGQLTEATLDFTQAMMLDPLNPKYYERRGEVYLLLGMTEEAASDQRSLERLVRLQGLNQAVAAEPRNATAWTDRAWHHWNRADFPQTKADMNKALEIDPKCGSALVLQGRIALAEKRYDDALKASETALETDAARAAYSVRGDAYLALAKYDEALDSFAAAKRFDASVAEAYFRKSQALADQGQAEASEAQLRQAKELDPEIENRLR